MRLLKMFETHDRMKAAMLRDADLLASVCKTDLVNRKITLPNDITIHYEYEPERIKGMELNSVWISELVTPEARHAAQSRVRP